MQCKINNIVRMVTVFMPLWAEVHISPGVIVFVFYGKKMKCIRILGHKWIHRDSDQINVFSACHNFKTNGNDLLVLINGPIILSFN